MKPHFLIKYTVPLLVILTITTSNIVAQDTLHLTKRSNAKKTFNLPLNDYYVFIKTEGRKKKKVIITDYSDSTFVYSEWTFKRKNRKSTIKKLREIHSDTTLTLGEIQRQSQSALYSKTDRIHISDLDKLIIPNRNRPEMKKTITAIDLSAVGWLLVGIPALAIFQSITYYAIWNVAGVGLIIVGIITENKTLRINKWKIKNGA